MVSMSLGVLAAAVMGAEIASQPSPLDRLPSALPVMLPREHHR
jgi:hypothetical protein